MSFYFFTNTAPDAMVILNRSVPGFQADISSDVISFNTGNSVNDSLASFSITLDNTNDKHVDRYGYVNIKKMSSIEIFVKDNSALNSNQNLNSGFYITTQEKTTLNQIISDTYGLTVSNTTKSLYLNQIISLNGKTLLNLNGDSKIDSGTVLQMPPILIEYKKIFLGVVETVSQSFSASSPMTITLSGKSIGYWLEASVVDIDPAGVEITQGANLNLQKFSNKYAESTALEIFKSLINFSTNDLLSVVNYNFENNQESEESIESAGGKRPTTNLIDTATQQPIIKNGTKVILEGDGQNLPLVKRLDAVNNAIQNLSTNTTRLNGSTASWANNALALQQTNKQIEDLSKNNNSSPEQINIATEKSQALQKLIQQDSGFQYDLDILTNYQKTLDPTNINSTAILNQFGIMDHWKQVFSSMVLEIADQQYLSQVMPFKQNLQDPQFIDGDWVSKNTIARNISDNLFFEFYVDTNGHFVLKPPFYNIGVPNDDPTYIIEEEDIISMEINDTVEGILTRVGVTGDINLPAQLEKAQTYNQYQDLNLMRDYGFHDAELQSLIFLRNVQDCADFGQAYLTKNNQEMKNASVTILGRPDIRLGTAIYLKPRDTVYYIKGISHNFVVGESFTTTLDLIGARRIVTAFKVESAVNIIANNTTFNTVFNVVENQKSKLTPTAPGTSSVVHYVLTNSTNVNELMLNTSNGSPSVLIAANVFVIINHSNIGFVGLIVDKYSPIIESIHVSKFLRIANTASNTSNINLSVGNTYVTNAINLIQNNFSNFLKTTLGTDGQPILSTGLDCFDSSDFLNNQANVLRIGLQFTNDVLNNFINGFLNDVKNQATSISQSSNSQFNPDTATQVQDLSTAEIIINQTINDLEKLGQYQQYTDENGRELPALLNYGRSLLIEDTEVSIGSADAITSALKQKAQTLGQKKVKSSPKQKQLPPMITNQITVVNASSNDVTARSLNNLQTTPLATIQPQTPLTKNRITSTSQDNSIVTANPSTGQPNNS